NTAPRMHPEQSLPIREQSRIRPIATAGNARLERRAGVTTCATLEYCDRTSSPRPSPAWREGRETGGTNIWPGGNRSHSEPVNVGVTGGGGISKPREEKFEWRCWRMPSRAEES